MKKEILNYGCVYNGIFDVKRDIKVIERLKEEIKNPHLLDSYGSDLIDFGIYNDDHFIGKNMLRWLFNENKKENEHIQDFLLRCSTTEDNRHITLLPEMQDKLNEKLNEISEELKEILDKFNEEKEEGEKESNKWKLYKMYKEIKPTGGEDGTNGYIDAEYISKNGTVVRMISVDIFDVGSYSFPQRLQGTDNVLSMYNDYTEDEKDLAKWLREYGAFRGVRM